MHSQELKRTLAKGDVDPTNNYTVRASCYNLAIEDLEERIP